MNLTIKPHLVEVLRKIHALDKKVFEKYLFAGVVSLGLLIGSGVYFMYSISEDLRSDISRLVAMQKKTRRLLFDYASINAEEMRLQTVLEQHKNFNLKIYFELFCKEQNLNPTSSFETSSTPINDQVNEIALTATFKGLTTEKIVTTLQAFDKTEIVYLKNIHIKKDKERTVTCEITLATIQIKAQG
jgi:hypothetical protein